MTTSSIKPKVRISHVLKSFLSGLKKYWAYLALGWGCVIVASTLQIIVPLQYKEFFDVLTNAADKQATAPLLIAIIGKILILNAIMWIGWRVSTFTDNYIQTHVPAVLKARAFDYLMDHSYTFFTNNFSGALVQKINRYARSFGRLLDQFTWRFIPLTINVGGIIYVLWTIKPLVALGVIVWTASFITFNYFFSIFKSKYDVQAAAADSEAGGYLSDAISNHSTVETFASQKYESKGYRKINDKYSRIALFSWNLYAVGEAVQAALIIILEFFVIYYAIIYWQQGLFTVGTFVLIQAYIIGLGDRLWGFSRVIKELYEGYADAREMVEILETPHDIKDVPGAKKLEVTKGEITFKNLEFSFNQTRTVLNKISETIKSGEKIALIGPSGAGKSTFVRLLLRFYEPTSGSICIDGQDIQKVTQKSLRSQVSIVPQDPILFHRSLKDNIKYGKRDATDAEVKEAARLAHCDEFIDRLPLNYDTLVGERGIKLSGGERQRIAIARAILKNAPVLILDEATSSLDSESEHLIQDALDTLMKGKTVIVIAHRLSTIRKMDRIVVIDGGKVAEQGTHDELLARENSVYKKLWNLQAGGFLQEE